MMDDGYKHAVPLSPQWLSAKHGDAKLSSELPSTPKMSEMDSKRGDSDRKKDWWRTLSPGIGTPDRERWREDEREPLAGRRDRWVEPVNRDREVYDSRRDGKWSNRWGPDDKEKDFRREKWLPSRGPSSLPKSAPGFGAGRGRGVGSVGFAAGRGRASGSLSSYSAALSGGQIGATPIGEKPGSTFKYPRGKLLDIYRKRGGASGFTENPNASEEVSESTPLDPLAFITPNAEEQRALESIWEGKTVSTASTNGKNNRPADATQNVDAISTEEATSTVEEAQPVDRKVEPDAPTVDLAAATQNLVAKPEEVERVEPPTGGNQELEADGEKQTVPQPEKINLLYVDPQGDVQGPFSGYDIVQWYEAGYFGLDLLVRDVSAPEGSPFVPLGNVMPQLVRNASAAEQTQTTTNDIPKEESKEVFTDKHKTTGSQTDVCGHTSFLAQVPVTLPGDQIIAGPLEQSYGLKDEQPVQPFMQREKPLRSFVHELEELELAELQLQQQAVARQQLQPAQLDFHMPGALPDHSPLPPKPSLQRSMSDRIMDPLRREQLAHHLLEQLPYQYEHQHVHPGLYGIEKQIMQQQEERLINSLSDQYLQLMQSRHQQDVLMQLLQQKQQEREILQQKQQERELTRLLHAPQNFHERRISGVWKVDESGYPMRVMDNMHQPRHQHQASLPGLYSRDERLRGFDERERLEQLEMQAIAGLQRASNENFFPQDRNEVHPGLRKESLHSIISGAGNASSRVPSWEEQMMQEQYLKSLERNQASLGLGLADQVVHSHKLDRQGLSSQEYMIQQLMRNQQLHERKVTIDQQMRELQPSLDKLWANTGDSETFLRRGLQQNGVFPGTANISDNYLKQHSAPLNQQGLEAQKGFLSGSFPSYDGFISDGFNAPDREVENRKMKLATAADLSSMQVRKLENGMQMSSPRPLHTDASQNRLQSGIQDFLTESSSATNNYSELKAELLVDSVSNGLVPNNQPVDRTHMKAPEIPVAPQFLLTAADVKSFRKWCETQIKELTGSQDMRQLEYCITLPSVLEAERFLSQYLGDRPNAQAFKGEFLRCKELLSPQMVQVFNSGHNTDAKVEPTTTTATTIKKKAKKGKKIVDPSLLGFNVASNRMLMGEIHYVDDS